MRLKDGVKVMSRTHCGKLTVALMAAALAGAVSPGAARAQSRNEVGLSTPGSSLGNVSTPANRFRGYSYGIGSLNTTSAGTGVLSSSITSRANFYAGGSTEAPTLPGLYQAPLPAAAAGSSRLYSAEAGLLTPLAYAQTGALITSDLPALSIARSYLSAIREPTTQPVETTTRPVTSLVPSAEGRYRAKMEEAEKLFRQGQYRRAYNEYQLASMIGDKTPESLLGMMHANFAMSRFSYASASYNLREALKYFPELPLAPLQPRSLWGEPDAYATQLLRLEEHTRRVPRDADAHLVLAYLKWFDGDYEAARRCLQVALKYGNSEKYTNPEEMKETALKFWDGMRASGKVSGELIPDRSARSGGEPASMPAPTAEPRKPAPEAET